MAKQDKREMREQTERLVREAMESGQMPLQESLVAYKRGAELLRYCQSTLKDAEQQVQIFEKGLLKAFEAPDADSTASDES